MTITVYCSNCDGSVTIDESELAVEMYCPHCHRTSRFEAPLFVAPTLSQQQKRILSDFRATAGDVLKMPRAENTRRENKVIKCKKRHTLSLFTAALIVAILSVCSFSVYVSYSGPTYEPKVPTRVHRKPTAIKSAASKSVPQPPSIQPVQKTTHTISTKPRTVPTFTNNSYPGDIFIDGFPMIDQGGMPWCSVASAARVLRFYGLRCDMGSLAKIFGTDAFGTNSSDFRRELSRIASAYGLIFRQVVAGQPINEQTVEAYNRKARSMYKPVLYEPSFIFWKNNQKFFDGEKFTYSLDYDVWRAIQLEDESRYDVFCAGVENSINSRTPLLWQVYLGLVREVGLASGKTGTHMRIILGYNAERQEIIYTDSWGREHAKKRMNLEEAYLSTRELMTISRR